jgi:hypothetical protein
MYSRSAQCVTWIPGKKSKVAWHAKTNRNILNLDKGRCPCPRTRHICIRLCATRHPRLFPSLRFVSITCSHPLHPPPTLKTPEPPARALGVSTLPIPPTRSPEGSSLSLRSSRSLSTTCSHPHAKHGASRMPPSHHARPRLFSVLLSLPSPLPPFLPS